MTAREQVIEAKIRTDDNYEGFVNLDGLNVRVRIIDARRVYGRVDALVTPVCGSGERWIDVTRIVKPETRID